MSGTLRRRNAGAQLTLGLLGGGAASSRVDRHAHRHVVVGLAFHRVRRLQAQRLGQLTKARKQRWQLTAACGKTAGVLSSANGMATSMPLVPSGTSPTSPLYSTAFVSFTFCRWLREVILRSAKGQVVVTGHRGR